MLSALGVGAGGLLLVAEALVGKPAAGPRVEAFGLRLHGFVEVGGGGLRVAERELAQAPRRVGLGLSLDQSDRGGEIVDRELVLAPAPDRAGRDCNRPARCSAGSGSRGCSRSAHRARGPAGGRPARARDRPPRNPDRARAPCCSRRARDRACWSGDAPARDWRRPACSSHRSRSPCRNRRARPDCGRRGRARCRACCRPARRSGCAGSLR